MLLSLALHAALIAAPNWLAPTPPPSPLARVDARLIPPNPAETPAEAVSSEPIESAKILPPPVSPPRKLQGQALRSAQTSLSEHLYYPPAAVANGIEGEVILLLALAENGQLVTASIARSSGHAILDQAALDAVRKIGALPGSPRQSLFPVRFRLE